MTIDGKLVNPKPSASQKGGSAWEFVVVIVQALVLALVVRTFFYQPFNIPSGSMKQTLLVGDYIFVSKMSYGYSKYSFQGGLNLFSGRILASTPKQGDVAVFRKPTEPDVDYIKRVIGLPGDTVQMQKGILYIIGAETPTAYVDEIEIPDCRPTLSYCRMQKFARFQETLPSGVKHYILHLTEAGDMNNTAPYKVRPGHYFMMGDNRDDSADSRVIGDVPFENFVGRADLVWFSGDEQWSLLKFWTWPLHTRWSRFFTRVH